MVAVNVFYTIQPLCKHPGSSQGFHDEMPSPPFALDQGQATNPFLDPAGCPENASRGPPQSLLEEHWKGPGNDRGVPNHQWFDGSNHGLDENPTWCHSRSVSLP